VRRNQGWTASGFACSLPIVFQEPSFLTGKLLVAAPGMGDKRFQRAVILLCDHDEEHAMGIVLNKSMPKLTLPKLLGQIGVENAIRAPKLPVLDGGPCQRDRGFVLHSTDWDSPDATVPITAGISMTATRDVLDALVSTGTARPAQALLALGYSGWGPGQLEEEIRQNAWLVADADPLSVLSAADMGTKWTRALESLGLAPWAIGSGVGRA
jgi:putative transcriptional regulator